jgi:chromosome segregation ATPase
MEASGLKNRGELLNAVLTQYELQSTRERVPSLGAAISAVVELSERIYKVLIGAGESIAANLEHVNAEHTERTAALNAEIARLTDEVEALKRIQSEQSRTICMESTKSERQIADLRDDLAQAHESIADKSALLDQYKATIEAQRQQLADKANSETAHEQFVQAQSRIKELEAALDNAALEKKLALFELEQRLFGKYQEQVEAVIARHLSQT